MDEAEDGEDESKFQQPLLCGTGSVGGGGDRNGLSLKMKQFTPGGGASSTARKNSNNELWFMQGEDSAPCAPTGATNCALLCQGDAAGRGASDYRAEQDSATGTALTGLATGWTGEVGQVKALPV